MPINIYPSWLKFFWRRIVLEVRRANQNTKAGQLKFLSSIGLNPKTVIDVGVHNEGTPELYATFSDANFILIEPAKEFVDDILDFCKRIKNAELIQAAASNRSGISKIWIQRTRYVHAGLVGPHEETVGEGEFQEVKMITLDELWKEKKMSAPFLIKIDVDGKDLEVLQGSCEILNETDCVIVEATTKDISATINFMETHGFFLWSHADNLYKENVLWQQDLIFLNSNYRNRPEFKPRTTWTGCAISN